MLPSPAFRLRAASVVAATLFLGAVILGHDAQAATVKCTDAINTASPVLSNGFGLNLANTRNQASAIDSSNVASLKVAYTHVANGATEKRGVPAVTEQTVYFSEGKDIVAANRNSGCEYWRFTGSTKSNLTGGNALRSSIHYLPPASGKKAMVFAGDYFGTAYGVDAQTGKQVWQAAMGTDSRNFITGSFQTYKGTLFIPVASKEVFSMVLDVFSACCSSHGLLQAVDPYTGKVKWTFHTTGSATSGTYDAKTGFKGPNGMSIWSTPTIDEANNAVLVGTGQHLSPPTTGNSDAIISLDADTGKVKWVFQATANDAWNGTCQLPSGLNGKCKFTVGGDYDFGAPPIVTKLPDGTPVILAGGKNGVVYSLNPKTGAKNWERKVGAGGALGGIHWGMTVDSQRVYAAVSDIGIAKSSSVSSLVGSSASGNEATPGATPGVYALDIRNGNVLWEKHDTHPYQGAEVNSAYSAALSLSNDVLFAANLNGQIKALRASTGAELWVFDTNIAVTDVHGVAGHGGTIDASGPVPVGRDLILNSGYSVFGGADKFNAGPGNVKFVFRLP